MENYLIVPVRLDALVLADDLLAVRGTADFTLLPYSDGTRDVNPDVANISEDIVSRPLQDRTLYLRAGTHLHWTLPGPLTRGSQTDAGMAFPAIPNRWLVVRSRSGAFDAAWVVESDYVHPDGEGAGTGAVTIPVAPGAPSPGVRPYRYLGRRTALVAGSTPTAAAGGLAAIGYPGGLTAVGYGDPTFASSYPNCASVLGLHDGEESADLDGLGYDVLGWYDDPANDFLAAFVAGLRAARSRDGQPPATDADLVQAAAESLGWTVTKADDRPFPTRMICAGRVRFAVPSPVENPDFLDDGTTVAVGNTGIEALSAFLARSIDRDHAAEIEDQIAAVELASFLDHRALDVGAKLAEGRHEGGFVAVPGGVQWDVRPEPALGAADAKADAERQEAPLPPAVAAQLEALNAAQREVDRRDARLESRRRQTFADWYKLMHCEYPPDDARDDYPDIDEVRHFIETRDLPPLREAAGPPGPSTPVGRRDAALSALQRAVAALPTTGRGAGFAVVQGPSPRFWQPTEPVVLLVGPAVRSLARPGKGGPLACPAVAGLADGAPTTWPTATLVAWLDALYPEAEGGGDPPGLTRWSQQPWSPSVLQWEVAVLPVAEGGNLDPASDTYAPGYITANYELPVDAPDLVPRDGRGGLTLAADVYVGRSLLTPRTAPALRGRLDAYLADPEVDTTSEAYAHLKAARDLLAAAGFACLSQALSGFNEALLMHKRTMQMEIDDPLGFAGDRAFSAEVARLVGKSYTSAPQPEWDFNPIRTGGMRVSRLRLVDDFGRAKDVDPGAAITPIRMVTRDAPTLVTLPPRLAQPSRLNFRWLSGVDGSAEADGQPSTSPVVGWLVPDNLDGSLQVYDAEGRPLGLINADAAPEAFPGGPAFVPVAIASPYLRRVVRSLVAPAVDARFLSAFLAAVESALENIDPEGYAQHADLALLMGRPIAVVRARLDLELQGEPAVHQAWNSFRLDLRRRTRDTDGFTRVAFPVRVGEFRQFNDGLVGYWVEPTGDAATLVDFVAPQGTISGDPRVRTHADDPAPLSLAIDDPPMNLTILLDPRGKVHATTGILPVKAIDVPPAQYAEALGAIEVVFLSTPVVTRRGAMNIPRPVEAGYRWSWAPDPIPLGEPDPQATFAGPLEIREGWLKLTLDPAPTAPAPPATGAT